MKKIIITVILIIIMPISNVGAEDKDTVRPVNDKTSMLSKGNSQLPAKYKYYYYREGTTKETEKADLLDCTDGQRRIIDMVKMSSGGEETTPYKRHRSTFWVTIQCGE